MAVFGSFFLPLILALGSLNFVTASNSWQGWAPANTVLLSVTVTERVIETQHETRTAFLTVIGPTTTQTEIVPTVHDQTLTQTQSIILTETPSTVTSVDTVTITRPPDVITQTVTVRQVDVLRTTVLSISTATETVTETSVSTVPKTIISQSVVTVINTIQSVTTETDVVSYTITVTSQQYISISATCTSGITTCPTRIINPTYTPLTPLPSNYLWGCPPGTLCHPKKENCNFEQNLPADSYICSPDRCKPVAELPPLRTFEENEATINDTCAFITPIDDYFNLSPLLFGLDYDIFNIYGQPKCTAPPVLMTKTVAGTCAPAQSWSPWSSTPTTTGRGNWRASSTGPAASYITKRAELGDRLVDKRQNIEMPKSCYEVCNQAMVVWQSIGRENDGCDQFESAFALVTSCTDKYNYVPVTSLVTSMSEPIDQCLNNVVKRNADEDLKAILKGSFRFARG